MRVTLHTDQASYRPGQPVHLRLALTNDAAEPVRLLFPSAQQFDFEVLWEDQRLWRWAADRLFAQVTTEDVVEPGQQREYEATWDGRMSDGQPVKAGEFVARGYLTLAGRVEPMADQTFTVIE
jgi:hypothetical protein